MSRRIITKSRIEDLLQSGQKSCPLGPRDIVTALAMDYARDVGVRLDRSEDSPAAADAASPASQGQGAITPGKSFDAEDVYQAVVSVLGREPSELRAIIDRVMKE